MEIKSKSSIGDDLKKYDYLAKDDDFIEITEWVNAEGWDINLNGKLINLSIGELDAINYLTQVLQYERKDLSV